MKKILLILVGGTICTALNEKGNLAVSEKMGILLKEKFLCSGSPYAKDIEFTLTENLYILSENMTVSKWNKLIETYKKYIKNDNFDGVIFAHGTDTLAYTASLFSILLSGTKIPHFFVSANAPLDSKRTNGNENFEKAVEYICEGIVPNVYVTYKNISDNKMYLHLASRIKQCENYTEDFYSFGDGKITFKPKESLLIDKVTKLENCVLKINPYVGMNYDAFDYSKFKAVLHGTYHSGTACSDEFSKLLENCKDADVYLSPSANVKGTYETVGAIGDLQVNNKKVHFLYGMTEEMAYCKLLVACSLFKDKNKIEEFVKQECNFEYFC